MQRTDEKRLSVAKKLRHNRKTENGEVFKVKASQKWENFQERNRKQNCNKQLKQHLCIYLKKCDALKKKTLELFSRNSVVMEPVLRQILF